jgi:predicted small secreted protein
MKTGHLLAISLATAVLVSPLTACNTWTGVKEGVKEDARVVGEKTSESARKVGQAVGTSIEKAGTSIGTAGEKVKSISE